MNKLPLDRPAQPVAPPASTGFSLWNLGFRPFYLLASLFSAFSVLLWTVQYSGYIQIAAVVRVFVGITSPGQYLASIQLSGLLWAAAFGLYAVRYWPILSRPRVDGKPG